MSLSTRSTTARQTEMKLKVALQELQASKDLSDKLIREREESEDEILKIINKNTQLKSELSELHNSHQEVIEQRDQLQELISSFHQCSDTHEQALRRITELELELKQAYSKINDLDTRLESRQSNEISNLYEELISVDCVPPSTTVPCTHPVVIDLTSDTSPKLGNYNSNICMLSNNKFKKYLKLKKFIIKNRNILNKRCKKGQLLKKNTLNNLKLHDYINKCNNKLMESQKLYDIDTDYLTSKINSLESSLHDLNTKYIISQKQIQEHILAMDDLIDVSKYNADRFESLTKHCTCNHTNISNNNSVVTVLENEVQGVCASDCNPKSSTMVFSDRIGCNFGSILKYHLKGDLLNYCMPEASFTQIINKIKSTKMNNMTTIVLFFGNSIQLNRQDVIKGIEYLLQLNVYKIVLCAFPYTNRHLHKKINSKVHYLNNLLHTLTCRHSDILTFFDTNSFISDFYLTKDTMYLSKSSKNKIATLVAYNIDYMNSLHGKLKHKNADITDNSINICDISTMTADLNCSQRQRESNQN